ncbi:MAG: ABC-F family ATP-binding cassette domain-containing protein [Clostridium sp.]|jgi:lincosamide and streptogramin A transport system ATP-binding/permease protein|nr:ABC-F family ATP-binding cassette domain-containing protein [Clostridium sp.]
MAQIQAKNLSFRYDGGEDVFTDMSFSIDTDWKLGLVGRNGKGKTTLLKLLMGEYEYRGKILSSEPFEYFPYTVSDPDKNTIDILDEVCPDGEFWMLLREMNLLELREETLFRPFSTLSRGEQTKAFLAALFCREGRFLLIDEPTNHLDTEGRRLVSRYLNGKKGFILVSHDRNFLDGCIDHVMALNRESIEIVQGSFSSWQENRERQDAFSRQENEKLKREIGRLQASAASSCAWADQSERMKIGTGAFVEGKFIGSRSYLGEKSRKMQQRRKNLERRQERAIQEKKQLLKDVEEEQPLKILPLVHWKKELLRVSNLRLSYQMGEEESDVSQREESHGLSFALEQGKRIALTGGNGGGKSSVLLEILKTACRETEKASEAAKTGNLGMKAWNRLQRLSGELSLPSDLKISYVPQDASFLTGDLTEFALKQGADPSLFFAVLRKLDIPRELFQKPMEQYSEGQKKKVLLARSLCDQAHLYVWDEPLNYIDIFSRMQIEEVIRSNHLTMLLVEHDQAFLEAVEAEQIPVGAVLGGR